VIDTPTEKAMPYVAVSVVGVVAAVWGVEEGRF